MKPTISASRTSPAATDNPTARPTPCDEDDDDDAAADAAVETDATDVLKTDERLTTINRFNNTLDIVFQLQIINAISSISSSSSSFIARIQQQQITQ